MGQVFVAFSEYLNFTWNQDTNLQNTCFTFFKQVTSILKKNEKKEVGVFLR